MIIINRINNLITGSVNGKSFSCTYDESKYKNMQKIADAAADCNTLEEMKELISAITPMTEESYSGMIQSKTKHLMVDPKTNLFYLVANGKVSDKPLPYEFSRRIIESVEKGYDFEPLLRCWALFLLPIKGRPEFSTARGQDFASFISAPYVNTDSVDKYMSDGYSHAKAVELSTTTQVAVTKAGLIAGYKVSEEVTKKFALDADGNSIEVDRYPKGIDEETGIIVEHLPEFVEDRTFRPAILGDRGDAFWMENIVTQKATLGHRIKVGHRHYLEHWSQVSTPGHKGLHFGGLSYIKGYQTTGTSTHNIFVNPMHIHTVRNVGDGACTCKEYFVHSSMSGPNRSLYSANDYMELTMTEYETVYKDAVTTSLKSEISSLQEKLNQLDVK